VALFLYQLAYTLEINDSQKYSGLLLNTAPDKVYELLDKLDNVISEKAINPNSK